MSARSRSARGDRDAGDVRTELPPAQPTAEEGPDKPTQLSRRSWWGVLKRVVKEYRRDNLSDWAAALTYYAILSLFPGLLVLVSALRLISRSAVDTVVNNIAQLAPGATRQILTGAVNNILNSNQNTASVLAIVSLLVALWSASGYVAAFMRASNAIYDVPEGRPIWKTVTIRVAVTVVMLVLLAVSAVAVVVTGGLADRVGRVLGIGSTAVTVWEIAKWPVLLVIVSFMFALLYWASPNAKQGFRWLSPGGILAVLLWVVASAAFAFYVANFGSYNKTYVPLASVIVFLVWLWISNIAILLGAELNAELERSRSIAAGHPGEREPYVELRDTSKLKGRDSL